MKLVLSKDVKSISNNNEIRLHAKCGDVLHVLLINKKGYICDSKYYPNNHIMVFKSQILTLIEENDKPLDDIINNQE